MFKFITTPIYNKFIRKGQNKVIQKLINEIEVKTVLEVGAMDNKLIKSLNKKVTAIDIKPSGEVIYGDVRDLKYNSNSFDVVVASNVLEHIDEPKKALKELFRVTKKRLIIINPNEPFFTICKGLQKCDEHLFELYPKFFYEIIGKPTKSKLLYLIEWVGVWDK